LQVTFLLLERSNKSLDECETLLRLLRAVHEKFVMPVLLKFGGLLAKNATETLTKLQLCSGPGCVEIGKALSAKVFHLRKEFLKASNATSKLFYRDSFGPHTGLF
jgi:hypothetical protein